MSRVSPRLTRRAQAQFPRVVLSTCLRTAILLIAVLSLVGSVSLVSTRSTVLPVAPSSTRGGHRRLLESTSTPESAARTSNVIQGGIAVKQCVESGVLGLYSGSFLLPEVFQVQKSISDCCTLCGEDSYCVAWDYCMNESGCELPEALVKQQSPLQKEGSEFVIPINETGLDVTNPSSTSSDPSPASTSKNSTSPSYGSRLPFGACVLTSRPLLAETAASKEYNGDGTEFGFFSATVDRLFLPYLNGFNVAVGKNISSEYDFPCGYSPRKPRCEIVGTIPEVAAICSADPRCKGFVYSADGGMGVLKGGEGTYLFSGDEFYDSSAVVYSLTKEGQQALQGGQPEQGSPSSSTSSSPSNLWIILISVLGGVAILSIIAVIITVIILSQRCDKLQKSCESYPTGIHASEMMDFDGVVSVTEPGSVTDLGSVTGGQGDDDDGRGGGASDREMNEKEPASKPTEATQDV